MKMLGRKTPINDIIRLQIVIVALSMLRVSADMIHRILYTETWPFVSTVDLYVDERSGLEGYIERKVGLPFDVICM